ncbi:chorismate mutase [Sphingomonas sp. RT2P30]|uniref:chorismate mutase n=1 Tax=Parasphingomonas halimpatiens TaxID=3096162 RepID=UPI002FC7C929
MVTDETLRGYRQSIDNIDAALVHMLAERFKVTQAVGRYKATSGLPPADPGREERQIARLRRLAEEADLDPEFSEKFLRFIIDEVIRHHQHLRETVSERAVQPMKIGIVGAGFIGRAVARLAVSRGHQVMLSNSRGPTSLLSTVASIGCGVGTVADAAAFGDLVLLAIPLAALATLDPGPFVGKIVMDADNYYPMRDGAIAALDAGETTTSEETAKHLVGAKVVKAWNAILERDIEKDARPAGAPGRRALPIAGDDSAAKQVVAGLIDELGYDVVDAGPLAEGWRFERARPSYCVSLDRAALVAALAAADRGQTVAEGSWRPAS